jgi:PKD repeat protein
MNYAWNFGDNETIFNTSSTNMSHIYQNEDDYTVSLTVTDNASHIGYISKTVNVWEYSHLLEEYSPVLYFHPD